MTTHASQTGPQSATDTAREVAGSAQERAGQVAGTAKEQAAGVAGTAKEQALDVAQDAAGQARNLLEELRGNVRDQVDTQRSNLARQLDGYAAELRQMAERSGSDGPATEAVRQVAARLGDVTAYLDGDGDVATDVRRFARRRPGTFLLACAAAGVLAGRATRGAAAARSQDAHGGGRRAVDVRQPSTSGDISRYRTDHPAEGYGEPTYRTPGAVSTSATTGWASGTGPAYGPGTSGTEPGGTAAGDPLGGIERTSDPNLRATSGPLAGATDVADPVPPDVVPGPTTLDDETTLAGQERTTRWEGSGR